MSASEPITLAFNIRTYNNSLFSLPRAKTENFPVKCAFFVKFPQIFFIFLIILMQIFGALLQISELRPKAKFCPDSAKNGPPEHLVDPLNCKSALITD